MGKELARYDTTTRDGKKVQVRVGRNDRGETWTLEANGRGYETLNIDLPRRER